MSNTKLIVFEAAPDVGVCDGEGAVVEVEGVDEDPDEVDKIPP